MPPVVCKFWQQGFCRNGNNCRFEHPAKQGTQQPQNSNRFGALAGPSNNISNRSTDPPYGLTAETIHRDLSSEVPPWILSCYGPGRDAPEQLFGGPMREQSFEEMRLLAWQGVQSGNPQAALQQIEGAYNTAQQQIQHALSNINQAMQFIIDAETKHPNRIDIVKASVPAGGPTGVFAKDKGPFAASSSPFGSSALQQQQQQQQQQPTNNPFGVSAPTGGPFGQPSALGQKPNPFGAPAQSAAPTFGQPAFGQPAALGSTPAFGQPSAPQSSFGAPSALGKPAFGQPAFGQSGFGQPAAPAAATPAFGQPSQPGSAFGQTSALGQKPNPFGAPAQAASNPFGAAQPAANNSPFGQPSQPAQPPGGFGQPTAPTNNVFGQPQAQPTNAFGQPATQTPASNPFGAPATTTTSGPFGSTAPAPANPFGAQASNQPNPSPFPQAAASNANPFGQPIGQKTGNPFGVPTNTPSQANNNPLAAQPQGAFGGPSFQQTPPQNLFTPATGTGTGTGTGDTGNSGKHPDVSTYSSKGPDGRLRMWKGKAVEYGKIGNRSDKEVPYIRAFNGEITRIWFPNGVPLYPKEAEATDPKVYEDPKVKEEWAVFQATGRFKDNLMPEVPPLRDYCRFDF